MNILAAICVDFVGNLRQITRGKGYQIQPLVLGPDSPLLKHYQLFEVRLPPKDAAPVDYYIFHPPERDHTLVAIKRPKCNLRIIQLEMCRSTEVEITYWRANGYKPAPNHAGGESRRWQTSCSLPHGWPPTQGCEAWTAYRIYRVTRRTKGKATYHTDGYNFADPRIPMTELQIVMATIEESYYSTNKQRRRRKRRKPEKFSKYGQPLCVDIQGHRWELGYDQDP